MEVFSEWSGTYIAVVLDGADSPDVILLSQPKAFDKYIHGMVDIGQLILTTDQARQLAQKLLQELDSIAQSDAALMRAEENVDDV